MITNKDLSIDSENGKIILNGDKYDLGTQGEIDAAVKYVYAVMGQNGAKNLVPYPYYETTKTNNGITFTDNGDGTITANGTATGTAQFGLVSRINSNYYLPNGVYTVTGCPNTEGCQIRVGRTVDGSDLQYGQDTGNGLTFKREDAANPIGIALQIATGTVVSNLTFKPMLRLASDTDNTYEPYAMTNKQLTDQVETLANAISYTDITVNKSTTGYAAPVESSGGVYYEALATYAALGITKDKILNIILVDWHDTAKSFNYYLGAASIGVLTDSAASIYKDTAAADLTLRIVYKN